MNEGPDETDGGGEQDEPLREEDVLREGAMLDDRVDESQPEAPEPDAA